MAKILKKRRFGNVAKGSPILAFNPIASLSLSHSGTDWRIILHRKSAFVVD
jgi:hypothetical protein